MKVLKGKVVSGAGNFSYWIDRLQGFYYTKTGLRLFPGTLNIELDSPYSLPTKVMRLEKEEYGGTVSINILPCRVFGRKAVILRTDNSEGGQGRHPRTIIEVASDVRLRDKYRLKDGDIVEVEVQEEKSETESSRCP